MTKLLTDRRNPNLTAGDQNTGTSSVSTLGNLAPSSQETDTSQVAAG